MENRVMGKVKEIFEAGFQKEVVTRSIGIEEELLIIGKDGEMGDTEEVWEKLFSRDWKPIYEEGKIKGHTHLSSGWTVTTDAGRGTLEIISLPEEDLHKINHYYEEILRLIRYSVRQTGQFLVGLGIQPYSSLEKKEVLWQKSRRYDLLRMKLAPQIDIATLTAATQTHVAVGRDEAFQAFLVLNALSGPMIAFSANSTVWQGEVDERVAVRVDCWKDFAAERSGMPPMFPTEENLLFYMLRLPHYFSSNGSSFFQVIEKEKDPSASFFLQESTCWWDSRLRSAYGTIEIRPCCQQPPWLSPLGLHALHLGLVENLGKSYDFVSHKPWSYWQFLRREAIKKGYCPREILKKIVSLAREGLEKRGKQEEVYLEEFLLGRSIESPPWAVARRLFPNREKFIEKFSF